MRFRFVFVVVAVAGAALAWPGALMGQKDGKAGGLSLRQKVDGEVSDLERNLKRTPVLAKRFDLIDHAEKDIRGLRKQNARQSEGDEIFFDQLEAILGEIPRAKAFKVADCKDYQANLIARFEPTFDEQAKNPAVKTGLKVLGEICR